MPLATVKEVRQVRRPATFETLNDATRRYCLFAKNTTNVEIERHLGVVMGKGDFRGSPCCMFYWNGILVAIRTKVDEIAIFHLYQSIQDRMDGIGERIID